jgi:carboxymethylenebutenolidase
MSQQALTAEEQRLSNLWDKHMRAEFAARRADDTMETMVAHPRVNQVPVMTGGEGRLEVHRFYAGHFLPQIPPDMEIIPVSRTIGQGRLVDEMVARFTHSIVMDWMLPGVAPTGKPVEVGLVVIVQFDGDSLAREHIYWDQASVLVQVGHLRTDDLPVVGAEAARSILDRKIPLNGLIRRAQLTRGDHAASSADTRVKQPAA